MYHVLNYENTSKGIFLIILFIFNAGNKRLQFLPLPKEEEENNEKVNSSKTEDTYDPSMVIPVDPAMVGIMRGMAYQNNTALSETESPCPSPIEENDEETSLVDTNNLNNKPNKINYHGGGFVKKSVPFPKIKLQRRKRLLALNTRERDMILRRQKRKGKLSKKNDKEKRFKTRRLLRERRAKEERKDGLPLTPPTSVSAPPTPPSSNTPHSETTDFTLTTTNLNKARKLTRSNLTKNNLEINNLELTTPCDTSGDETSSKSTLDLIIPPPKDFEGKNNPFHTLLKGNSKNKTPSHPITLPLPLTAVIPSVPVVRTAKRQLSEKDICIGPNGEVKRRRLRRGRAAQLAAAYLSQQTASKTATVVPAKNDQRALRSSLQQQNNSTSPIG